MPKNLLRKKKKKTTTAKSVSEYIRRHSTNCIKQGKRAALALLLQLNLI